MNCWVRAPGCEAGNCVEVQDLGHEVWLRNSGEPTRTLRFTSDEWAVFMEGIDKPWEQWKVAPVQ